MFVNNGEYYPEGWKSEGKRDGYTALELLKMKENGTIAEGRVVMCDSQHNMTVDLGAMKGIIPRNEGAIGIEEGKTKDIALISRVGRKVCFVISDFCFDDKGKQYALLSRKTAQQRCLRESVSKFALGDVVKARITHLESFGAFCDIGCGNIALLPIDLISVSRISHPRDRFFVGQNIRALVQNIDDFGRITLSHKELLGTWEENVSMFSVGQTVSGIVRSIEEYGIFVELTPNLAGLAELKEGVNVGQTAGVYIKSINPEKMKVKLIIIDTFDSKPNKEFTYFFNQDRMDSFYYSPKESDKQIITEFI